MLLGVRPLLVRIDRDFSLRKVGELNVRGKPSMKCKAPRNIIRVLKDAPTICVEPYRSRSLRFVMRSKFHTINRRLHNVDHTLQMDSNGSMSRGRKHSRIPRIVAFSSCQVPLPSRRTTVSQSTRHPVEVPSVHYFLMCGYYVELGRCIPTTCLHAFE